MQTKRLKDRMTMNVTKENIEMYRLIEEMKEDIERKCLEKMTPYVMQVEHTIRNSNATLQAEVKSSINELKKDIWSRWHIAAMWVALIISIIVGRI